MDNLETVEFVDVLGAIAEDQHLTRCAQVSFTSTEEDQTEQRDQETIDDVLGDQDMEGGEDALEEADREADLLEQMPLPGHPESEKERLASWLRLPRRARVAVRRLHRNLRHLPKEALVQMFRAARAPRDYISAAKTCRCQGCDNTKPRPQTQKVSPPRPYTFNHEVGIDVFEIVDSDGMRFSILNAVCMGTTYDQAWIVRESESLGSPSSHACSRAFVHRWTCWAGCLNAANEMTRRGSFAPPQWVLSRVPRNPATVSDEDERLDVGALQAHADGPSTFGVQSRRY